MKTSQVVGVALTLTVLGGCAVPFVRRDPSPPPGSTVSNTAASLDFETMPTRTEVGMGPDGYVTYPNPSWRAPVPTTLRFPTGTVRRDFFAIDIGTNYAFAADPDLRHQPTDFDFSLHAANLAQAQAMLTQDAAALGLSAAEIDDVTAQGTSVELGYVRGWLSTEVAVRDAGNGDGALNLVYTVTIGRYHNEATDAILHDGAMTLDLRTRPSAADLGFRETYDSATVDPEPHRQLSVTLRTPTGRTTLPTDSLLSDRSGGGPPTVTVLLGSTSLARAPTTIRSAGGPLGFDPRPALALVRRAGPDLETLNQACTDTDIYTCALRFQTTTDGFPEGEGSLSYRLTLTYR